MAALQRCLAVCALTTALNPAARKLTARKAVVAPVTEVKPDDASVVKEACEVPPFNKVMAANRAEIAVRIMRAGTELNMATVGVYAMEDRNSAHRWCAAWRARALRLSDVWGHAWPVPFRGTLCLPGLLDTPCLSDARARARGGAHARRRRGAITQLSLSRSTEAARGAADFWRGSWWGRRRHRRLERREPRRARVAVGSSCCERRDRIQPLGS